MTDSSREKEIELIQGLKTGDNDSFQEAVRAYTPGMLAVARFYLDHSSAEEAVQDCWVKVIDAIHGFEGRSGLKTWLHRVVANRCKNQLRSAKREVSSDFSEALEPALSDRFNAKGRWELPPKLQFHDSADTLMENGALSDCLDKHLSALPETQRSALMLYEAHQHKSDDVCNILDVSASNLRVLLHRARQKIFLMVENFQETGEC
ncbi:RNA polymerase sigma factor [Marinobacter adhaerens]|jgi:RNA polymerase sigma-70 factor (ECF subfamily)|uniref:RNA polymerase sigma factor n=3 Tax=Marinobacter adhaerens TaxID=1033846 RepID=A0ABX8IJN6_9GAMM|nr:MULTISPECIES: RNA polymerase sigma factor [Marinobacter]MBQ93815.1 RNA polymerase sigma factor [Marinobacter sp.]ADP99612.1 RNA polymerase, sigma-24 subunit, ECF subfamily [Marinobacter adhaerens HP15]AKV96452.1 RNA polymerase sigma 70 [Marinobacter sp. CP1]MBW4977958.1 RNA polymerase sigma factor [Marinobacter adhaerens]MCW8868012.1 RNA polymerase sigma factor [Marinobacter sp.]|tara:strand:+ start:4219 stop:4836 length:618 start_codon:yes stop_codon:yes gene_type:complete